MFLFTKISLTVFLMLTVALVAEMFGILNKTYGHYIFIAGLLIQIIMLIIIVSIVLIRKNQLKKGVKIIRYKIMDKYIKGGTELIPQYMAPTNPRKSSIFKIFVEAENFKESPDFGICKMGKGNVNIDIKKHILSIRAGIADKSFIFDADILMRPDERINCKFKDDINIKTFFIGELYMP